MKDKNRETTTIKQTFSYGKSKTVTVEVVQKRKNKEKNILSNKVKNKSEISNQPRKKLTINKKFHQSFKNKIFRDKEKKNDNLILGNRIYKRYTKLDSSPGLK